MYQKLTKEEKKNVVAAYKITNRGSQMYPVLNRLVIEGIICLILAIIMILAIIFFEYSVWLFALIGILIIAGLVFLIAQRKIRMKEYNRFMKLGYKNVKKKLTKKK